MSIPIPRDPDVNLTGVPRHWFGGNAVATAISNGLNMLFPVGERYFVRSVKHFLEDVRDPTLREQVRAFFKQEGKHAGAHEDFNDILRSQGFDIDGFLKGYERLGRVLEDMVPAKLNLAGTAAAEHFTAIMADGAFRAGVLDILDPRMQKLIAWHAAEEIEHKAVAFDVLREIDDSYALRVAGLAYATMMLGMFWAWGTLTLLRQEKLGVRGTLRELRRTQAKGSGTAKPARGPAIRNVFIYGIRQYLRRDFHPSNNHNEHLAARWFAAHGLPFTEAA
jgi:predicted metal-dependent hydrolase